MQPIDNLARAMCAACPGSPSALFTTWADVLRAPMESSGINTPKRIAAFIGQVAHESGGFRVLGENLNYSAERLCQVWPARFTPEFAAFCAGKPDLIADSVYCNRMGNGTYESGDGWRFRGGGLIQLTGRTNYTAFGASIGKTAEAAADYVRTPTGAAVSACWFWNARNLNRLADGWLITGISQAINGGTNGITERLARCNNALTAINSARP